MILNKRVMERASFAFLQERKEGAKMMRTCEENIYIYRYRRGKNFNFTHQKVNKLNFGDFPLHCIRTCALGKKNMEDAIKGRKKRRARRKRRWKKKERNEEKKDGGKRSEGAVSHMTCSHSPQPVMSFLMTVMRTDLIH